jgi:tRNA A-37 threonylcarbamoyl transferase component Bud32
MFSRDPVRLEWDLPSPAGIRDVWALLSDTDRFNRVAGLGFHFDSQPDGSTRGSVQALGMEHVWVEEPWEYEAPRWFRSRRAFIGGPVERIDLQLRLDEVDGGTRVRYAVLIVPRAAVARPILAAQAALQSRPQIDRTLRAALSSLERAEGGYDPPPPPLPEAAEGQLSAALQTLPHPKIAARIGDLLRHEPLVGQDRMRPLALARRWGVDPDATIHCFLAAVHAGTLGLRWDLLCPRCRVGKASQKALGDGPVDIHCGSCGIKYDASFPDNIEVVFRPAPWMRQIEVEPACAMSPGRTPHVLLRRDLQPGKSLECVLELDPGVYLLRCGDEAISLEVGVPGAPTAVTADVTPQGLRPRLARLGPGPSTLLLRNRLFASVGLLLEERQRPPDTLTAGALLGRPDARLLLPADALRPGIEVEILHGVVVAADHPTVDFGKAVRTYRANGVAIGVWGDVAGALAVAARFAGKVGGACGLELGPVQFIDGVPSGSTVDAALHALRGAAEGAVALGVEARAAGAIAPVVETLFDPPTDIVPATVPGFTVGLMIGEGAFGRVYAAESMTDGARRVIKVLKPEHSVHPDRIQRFFNEGRLLSEIDHPNTVRVYDWGETAEGLLYLIMERLDGRELAEILREQGRVTPDQVRRIARDALAALEAVHRKGIVHRDIKPANMLVCRGPSGSRVCLIDFGIARRVSELPLGSEKGFVVGTPIYMSPEQVQGKSDIDARADLYSLGISLYECLSGGAPFQGPTAIAIAMRRLKDPPAPLNAELVPATLAAAVMRALEVERTARWQSAAEMAAAIEES